MTNLDVAMDETVDYVFGEFEDFIETTREHHSFPDSYMLAMRAQIRMEIVRILIRNGILKTS